MTLRWLLVAFLTISGAGTAAVFPFYAESIEEIAGSSGDVEWIEFGNYDPHILAAWVPLGGGGFRLAVYFEKDGRWALTRNEVIFEATELIPYLHPSMRRLLVAVPPDLSREYFLVKLEPWRLPVKTCWLPLRQIAPELCVWPDFLRR